MENLAARLNQIEEFAGDVYKRQLQEARQLLDAGVDVRIGYIETHGRAGTEALVEGDVYKRQSIFF